MNPSTSSPIDPSMYSTPPSTPSVFKHMQQQGSFQQPDQAVLARRSSRPHMIHISKSQGPPVQIALDSPAATNLSASPNRTHLNGHASSSTTPLDPSSVAMSSEDTGAATVVPDHHGRSPGTLPKSPCFVHSLLDKGASLTDWLKSSSHGTGQDDDGKPKDRDDSKRSLSQSTASLTNSPTPSESSNSLSFQTTSPTEYDEEEDGAASLTRQLAATAVGVREMSKQLGRARVRSNIQNVMIITKARDNRLIKLTRDLALYLMGKRCQSGRGMIVYVDHQLRTSKRFDAAGIERDFPDYFRPQPRRFSSTSSYSTGSATDSESTGNAPKDEGQLRYWTTEMCSKSPHLFDFVITLGGDGTVLFTSWLFQTIVPPVLPFALGSLGFLTNFDFADHQKVIDNVVEKGIRVNLRMRFTCTVYRAVKVEEEKGGKRRRCIKKGDTGQIFMKNLEEGGWERLEGNPNAALAPPPSTHRSKDKDIMCFTTRPVESFEVINDLVVDRGPSPYVSLLELFGDEHHLTTVQADGLCVSTPTGSTAYSLSAGGSLGHPEIPAIFITPICPHTLSFRPMLLPDSMELRICVPYNSRSTAWASFDGRGRVELKQGDHIKVTASKFPFPTVCAENQSVDWFKSISRTLKWNERERQKSFVVVEEDAEPKKKRKSRRMLDATPSANDRLKVTQAIPDGPNPEGDLDQEDEEDEDDEDEEEEEEEEKYDIDDSSPEAVAAAAQASAANSAAASPVSVKQQPPPLVNEPPTSSSEDMSKPTSFAAQRAARALAAGGSISSEGHGSGIETPGRYAVDVPHPPKVHARHLLAEQARGPSHLHHHHHQPSADQPQQLSPQVPMTSVSDNMPTPRPQDQAHRPFDSSPTSSTKHHAPAGGIFRHAKRIVSDTLGHRRGRSTGDVGTGRRTFAVYGQDESDSNASD